MQTAGLAPTVCGGVRYSLQYPSVSLKSEHGRRTSVNSSKDEKLGNLQKQEEDLNLTCDSEETPDGGLNASGRRLPRGRQTRGTRGEI